MTMKKLLIGIAILVAVIAAIQYSRRDYLTFDAQREDWHRRCDAYVGSVAQADRPSAEACQRELKELMAYAERKGWR